MDLGNGLGHLTYSTLVHPGDTWEDMWTSLTTYVPQVQKRVCPTAPFGVSLRLSNSSASTLVKSKPERDKLKSFLADNNMYLYTVNAFPYGPFKNQIVKEQVYEPDWRSEERTQYTINVAEILADVVPASIQPSIQSAPLGFKPNVTGKAVIDSYTEHVMRVASHLIKLEQRTGRVVTLALEPEPFCFLETTDETIDYFTNHLYTGKSAEMLAKFANIPIADAILAQRKFVGMVFDICHQAVVYEDIEFEPSGQEYTRPDWVNFGFANGGMKYPGDLHSAAPRPAVIRKEIDCRSRTHPRNRAYAFEHRAREGRMIVDEPAAFGAPDVGALAFHEYDFRGGSAVGGNDAARYDAAVSFKDRRGFWILAHKFSLLNHQRSQFVAQAVKPVLSSPSPTFKILSSPILFSSS